MSLSLKQFLSHSATQATRPTVCRQSITFYQSHICIMLNSKALFLVTWCHPLNAHELKSHTFHHMVLISQNKKQSQWARAHYDDGVAIYQTTTPPLYKYHSKLLTSSNCRTLYLKSIVLRSNFSSGKLQTRILVYLRYMCTHIFVYPKTFYA